MDNELHALENIEKDQCDNCGNWKQFNHTTGFCNDEYNWHDETFYTMWCARWKPKS